VTRRAGTLFLFKAEPTRGFEPRTYRLQDSPSTLTMAATTDFTVYSDHSDRHIGSLDTSSRHLVSRRPHRRCDLQLDPLDHHGTACVGTGAPTAACPGMRVPAIGRLHRQPLAPRTRVTSRSPVNGHVVPLAWHGIGRAGPTHRDMHIQPRTGQKYATSSSTSSKRSQ
jgi:hypothetical protein